MEGAITGNGNVVLGKSDISSQGFFLSGNNTFTGGMTLRAGARLFLNAANSLGAPGNTLTVDDGTISIGALAASPLTIDASSNLTIAAGGVRFSAGGQSIIIASQLSGSNPIRFGRGSFPGEETTYDVRLTHAENTFVGDIQLGESQFFGSAMLGLVADGSLGNAANRVTLGSKFFDGERLKSDRGGLRTYANFTLPASRVIRLEGSTDPSDDRGGVFDTNGFNLTVSGGISELSAGMPLVKAGAGTLTLNGIQTYTGITDVQEGTLAGTGTLGPIKVFSAATLAPGSSVGTLRTGNATFHADSTLALDFSSPSVADQLAVTGTVSLGGNVALALTLNYTPAAGDAFVVIANDGADPINTSGGLFAFGGTPLAEGASFQAGGANWTISYIGGTGNDVTLSPTPATTSNLAMTSFNIGNPAGGAAGKRVQGTISGSPGASIRLMRSATLADWTLLSTIVLDGSGQGNFDVIDPLATDRAFYSLFFP
jgi:autotransporter-associated beta strand protein